MPFAALRNLAQDARITMDKAEEYWNKAKGIANDENRKDDYAYIMGIVKKMMGLKNEIRDTYTAIPILLEAANSLADVDNKKWDKPYLAKLRGTFMEFDVQNQNGRTYKLEIANRLIGSEKLKKKLEMRAMLAQGNHPKEGLETDISKIGGVVTEWSLVDNKLIGVIEVLNTTTGRDIYELLKAKIPVGVSARGYGDMNKDGTIITESYELITFDLVIDPSFENAVPQIQEILERYKINNNVKEIKEIFLKENNMKFSNLERKSIVLEDIYFEISRLNLQERNDQDKFLIYVKSYIAEAAEKYFDSENLFSIDSKQLWEIADKVLEESNLFELESLADFNKLTKMSTEATVSIISEYVKTILREYNTNARKIKTKLEENYFFKYLNLVAKTSQLIESTKEGLFENKEEEFDMGKVSKKKKFDEANDDEEFVLADFDEEDVEDEEETGEEETEEVEEANDERPVKGDYQYYDEEEYTESNESGYEEEDLNDNEGEHVAETAKTKNESEDVEGAEETKDLEDTLQGGGEVAVKASEARKLASKYNISLKEAATILLSHKIIERIELSEAKKAKKGKLKTRKPLKKATTKINQQKAKKESVEITSKEPVKVDNIQTRKTEGYQSKLNGDTREAGIKLCESFFGEK